jgi:hypothetical protein
MVGCSDLILTQPYLYLPISSFFAVVLEIFEGVVDFKRRSAVHSQVEKSADDD